MNGCQSGIEAAILSWLIDQGSKDYPLPETGVVSSQKTKSSMTLFCLLTRYDPGYRRVFDTPQDDDICA